MTTLTASRTGGAKTLIDMAYERLREDILAGAHPPGERLRVEHLRADYGVGASTLREALARLLAEDLVRQEGQRGFRVAPVSLADLADITAMRQLLETRALRQSIADGDDDWEAGIVAAFHGLSRIEERLARGVDDEAAAAREWEGRNQAFHDALIGACASPRLRQFRAVLYRQHERYRRLALLDRSVPRDVHAEHQAIFDAVLARAEVEACRLTEEHIQRTADVVAKLLADRRPAAE